MDNTLEKARIKRSKLSLERLRALLHYDPITGVFTWLVNRGGTAQAGTEAGVTDNGYVLIGIDGVKYQAHVLAWFYMWEVMPDFLLDHEDGDRANNRFENIRKATRSQNNANVGVRPHSRTGVKGVQRHRSGRFTAKIQINGRQKYLGIFDTAEEAGEAYRNAAEKAHGEFAGG